MFNQSGDCYASSMKHPWLTVAIIASTISGAGCSIQNARSVPKEAKAVFTSYLDSIRSADYTAMDQALCTNINHDPIIQDYQHTFDVDRGRISDAFQGAVPDAAGSTDTRLEFIIQLDLSSGYTTRRIDLNHYANTWCISE